MWFVLNNKFLEIFLLVLKNQILEQFWEVDIKKVNDDWIPVMQSVFNHFAEI